jgi:polar amino acid transport system substrate-binding protein
VLRHLLATRFTATDRDRVVVNDRVFRERPVHLCFRRSPEGQLQQRAFNDAARTLDFNQLEKDYWRRIGQPTGN